MFFDRVFSFKQCQIRARDGAAERIARVSMAVKESFELFVFARKAEKISSVPQSCRQRQVTAGDTLRQAEQVGRYVRVLAGKHLAGPAETRGDFIKNEKNAVAPADVMQCLNITGRLAPTCPPRPCMRGSMINAAKVSLSAASFSSASLTAAWRAPASLMC